MFDFFFDTADINYIQTLWGRLKKTIPASCVRGITTNPNAFFKIDETSLTAWEKKLPQLCALVTEIRGDDKGIVYVQVPNSDMEAKDVIRWAQYISQFTDGTTSLGLKIPPFRSILEVVDELNAIMETNVTGVAECSTALSCLSYRVKYVSIIPGRMEEKGIDAKSHIAFAQRRRTDGADIIAGSMRTLEGLKWVVEYGTIPTIGTRVWDRICESGFDISSLLDYKRSYSHTINFSPPISEVNTSLSVDFFEQMDKCGAPCYEDWLAKGEK